MAKATTTSTAQRYVIHYTIRDGDHEYRQDLTELFSAEPTEELVVHALVDNLRCEDGDLAKQQKDAWKQYQHDQYLEIPGDYRLVNDITWELECCPGCHMAPCACIPVGHEQETPSGYTPGPWYADNVVNRFSDDDDRDILLDVPEAEASANAQLMAKAPQLVEALVRLLECPDLNVDELDVISIEAIQNARRALTNAKGEA